MAFLGNLPYGTDRGTDTQPAGDGTNIVTGIGIGVQFTMSINGPISVRDTRSFTELYRITGAVTAGAPMATIVVTSNGILIDSSAGTLNFNPSPDNSFKVNAAGGVESIALNYHATGGIYGSILQPAMLDHSHNAAFPSLYHHEYDAVASGTIAVTSTTGALVTGQTIAITMPNDGRSYLLNGTAAYSIYGSTAAYIGVSVAGANPRYYMSSNEVNPAARVVRDWAVVPGSGQVVNVQTWGKITSGGTGWVGSGMMWAELRPMPLIAD